MIMAWNTTSEGCQENLKYDYSSLSVTTESVVPRKKKISPQVDKLTKSSFPTILSGFG